MIYNTCITPGLHVFDRAAALVHRFSKTQLHSNCPKKKLCVVILTMPCGFLCMQTFAQCCSLGQTISLHFCGKQIFIHLLTFYIIQLKPQTSRGVISLPTLVV